MIVLSFAVLITLSKRNQNSRSSLKCIAVVINGTSPEEIAEEVERLVLDAYPPEDDWEYQSAQVQEIDFTGVDLSKARFVHLYILFAQRHDEKGLQIKAGLTHEINNSSAPTREPEVLAMLFNLCPEKSGWNSHDLEVVSRPLIVIPDDAPNHLLN